MTFIRSLRLLVARRPAASGETKAKPKPHFKNWAMMVAQKTFEVQKFDKISKMHNVFM